MLRSQQRWRRSWRPGSSFTKCPMFSRSTRSSAVRRIAIITTHTHAIDTIPIFEARFLSLVLVSLTFAFRCRSLPFLRTHAPNTITPLSLSLSLAHVSLSRHAPSPPSPILPTPLHIPKRIKWRASHQSAATKKNKHHIRRRRGVSSLRLRAASSLAHPSPRLHLQQAGHKRLGDPL